MTSVRAFAGTAVGDESWDFDEQCLAPSSLSANLGERVPTGLSQLQNLLLDPGQPGVATCGVPCSSTRSVSKERGKRPPGPEADLHSTVA